MTRKDYIVLAAAIRRSALKNNYCAMDRERHMTYVKEVGYALLADNNNFDWDRWIKACDPEGDG